MRRKRSRRRSVGTGDCPQVFLVRGAEVAPTPQPLACRAPVTAFHKRLHRQYAGEREMRRRLGDFGIARINSKLQQPFHGAAQGGRRGGRPPQRRRDCVLRAVVRRFGWSASLSPIAQPTSQVSCTARAGASVVSATRRPSERLPTRPPAAQRRRSRGSPRRRRSPSGRAGRRRPPSPVRSRRFRLGSDGR